MSSLGSRHTGASSEMSLDGISGSGGGPGPGGRPDSGSGSGSGGGIGGDINIGSGPRGPSAMANSSTPSSSSRNFMDHSKLKRKNYYSRDFQSSDQSSLREPLPHTSLAGSPPQFPAAHAIPHHLPHYNYRNYLASGQSQIQAHSQSQSQSQSHNYLPSLALFYSYSPRQNPNESSPYYPRARPQQSHQAGDSRLTSSGYSQKPYRSFSADDNYDDSRWRPLHFRKGPRFKQSGKDYFKDSYPDRDPERYANHNPQHGNRLVNGEHDRMRNHNGDFDRSRTQNGEHDRSRIYKAEYAKPKTYNGDYDRHKPYGGSDRKMSYGNRSTSYSDESVIRHGDHSDAPTYLQHEAVSSSAPIEDARPNRDSANRVISQESSRDPNYPTRAEVSVDSDLHSWPNNANIAQAKSVSSEDGMTGDPDQGSNRRNLIGAGVDGPDGSRISEPKKFELNDEQPIHDLHGDQPQGIKLDGHPTSKISLASKSPANDTAPISGAENSAEIKVEQKLPIVSRKSIVSQPSAETEKHVPSPLLAEPANYLQELYEVLECSFPLNRLDDMYHQLVKDYASESSRPVLPFLASEPVSDFEHYPFYGQNLKSWPKLKCIIEKEAQSKRSYLRKRRGQLWEEYKSLRLISEKKRADMEQQLRIIYDGNDEKRRELDLVNQRSTPGPSVASNTPGSGSAQNTNEAVVLLSRLRRHGDSVTTEAEFQEILASLERQQRQELGPLAQAQAVAAEIPAMELDPTNIKHTFYDANNIVRDKAAWALRIHQDFSDDWSPLEHERFTEGFLAMPKRFGAISRALDGVRSPGQCVIHYYATKKASNYKLKLLSVKKKPGRKPGRKRGRRPASAGSTGADTEDLQPENDVTTNPVTTDVEDAEDYSLKRARSPSPVPLATEPAVDLNLEEQSELEDPRRKTCSSYWKFHEVAQFPLLLEAFGTRWTLIADELHTKTANMVRNYYSRNANKNGWIELAQYADQRYRENTFDRLNVETESEAEQTQEVDSRGPIPQMTSITVSERERRTNNESAVGVSYPIPTQSNTTPLPRHHQLILSILNLDAPLPISQSPTEDVQGKPTPPLFSLPSTSNQLNKLLN